MHKESQSLILNLANNGRVVGVVPGAREITLRGHKLVAVPFKLDAVRILRNIGINAPSPIEYFYDWPNTNRPPMAHQRATAAFLTLNKRAYLLSQMGTGKTLCILWAWHYLRQVGQVDAMLVIAPLSTLERTWGDEIFSTFFDVSFTVLHGDADRRIKRSQVQNDIYIINHDGVKNNATALAIKDNILTRYGKDRVLVVIDEIDAYSNAQSDRWQDTKKLIGDVNWLWGASGSPTPTAPTDAWAACRLITPATVPAYFSRFRERTMTKVTQFKWRPKPDATAEVHRVMQPGIRYTRAECFDLPPILTRFANVELTAEQRAAYRTMLVKSTAEVEGEKVTALNEGVKLQKLVQIACGVLYDEDETYSIPTGPRVALVRELVRQSEAKTILFVPITGALDMIAAELAKDFELLVIDGRTPIPVRNQHFADFKSRPNIKLLIAQPGCMSHGLNLQEASTIIWYCPTNSNRIYTQANDRIPRPGQKNDMFIVKIEGTHVEREMYRRLETQGTMQGALLAAYERQRVDT